MFVAPFAAPFPSPIASPGTVAAEPWYLAGGVALANCKAAYQPIGAASLAASYSNIANPGTNDAAPGTAPTWASATGWTFSGTQHLTTGLVFSTNYSAVARFSGGIATTAPIFGPYDNSGTFWLIWPHYTDNFSYYYVSGGSASSPRDSGVIGMAAGTGAGSAQGYHNGVADGAAFTPGAIPSAGMQIARQGSTAVYWPGSIQALAVYNVKLTAAQMLAISNAAAALTG